MQKKSDLHILQHWHIRLIEKANTSGRLRGRQKERETDTDIEQEKTAFVARYV